MIIVFEKQVEKNELKNKKKIKWKHIFRTNGNKWTNMKRETKIKLNQWELIGENNQNPITCVTSAIENISKKEIWKRGHIEELLPLFINSERAIHFL